MPSFHAVAGVRCRWRMTLRIWRLQISVSIHWITMERSKLNLWFERSLLWLWAIRVLSEAVLRFLYAGIRHCKHWLQLKLESLFFSYKVHLIQTVMSQGNGRKLVWQQQKFVSPEPWVKRVGWIWWNQSSKFSDK